MFGRVNNVEGEERMENLEGNLKMGPNEVYQSFSSSLHPRKEERKGKVEDKNGVHQTCVRHIKASIKQDSLTNMHDENVLCDFVYVFSGQ